MFICATDEPGTPAELAALEEGKSVQDYCGAVERGGLRRSPSSMRHAWIANLLRVALGDRFAGESANAGCNLFYEVDDATPQFRAPFRCESKLL
jgi:hypothetical protein